jgi:hypothetical protein
MAEKAIQQNESSQAAEAWSDSGPVRKARVFKLGGLPGGVEVERPPEKEPPERNLEVGLKIESRPARGAGGSGGAALEISVIGGGKCHRLEAEAMPDVPVVPHAPREFKPREPRGQSAPGRQASEWGGPQEKSRPRSHRWILHWGGGVLGLIVLAFVVNHLVADRDSAQGKSPYGNLSLEADEYDATGPSAFFDEHPDWVRRRTIAAFHAYRKAKTYQEARPFMRKPSKPDGEMERVWKPWADEPVGELTCASNSVGKLPFVILSGTRADQSEFDAYFVRDGDAMKFDWDATHQAGDFRVADLAGAESVGNALVRCVADVSQFYTLVFTEDRYRCYRLASADGQSYVWGYAERGSRTESLMSEQLREQPILLDKEDHQKITLRLSRGAAGASANQFVITSILHNEWVNP